MTVVDIHVMKTAPFIRFKNFSMYVALLPLVMISIATLCPALFQYVVSTKKVQKAPYLYLSQPSKYNKYLRLCLLSWISENNINMDYVLPNTIPNINTRLDDLESDSDEDMEVKRVDPDIASCLYVDGGKEKHADSVPESSESISDASKSANIKKKNNVFQCEFCNRTLTRRNDLKITFHGSDNFF